MVDIPLPINIDLLHPSFGNLVLATQVFQLSGAGQLAGDPAPLFPSQFGLWWEFTVVPENLGRVNGPTIHYHQRMVQWRLIHTVGGIDLVSELLDADYDRVIWMWQVAKPTRIEYSILPGVVLNARKIASGQPPTLETTPR